MKKRIAVIGYGGQGAWHADHALRSDVVELAGVYDIRETRNDAARARGIFVYDSLDAVIADETVEIVVCATPNDAHLDVVVRSLLGGKNVVCEKPASLSVSDFDKMTEAEARSGKLLTLSVG